MDVEMRPNMEFLSMTSLQTTTSNWSPGQESKSSQIYGLHFEDEEFDNFFAQDWGFTKLLRMKKDVIPRVNMKRVTPERKQQLTQLEVHVS